jgi:hypothetical protein
VGLSIGSGGSVAVSDVAVTRSSSAGVGMGTSAAMHGDHLLVRDVVEGPYDSNGAGLAAGPSCTVDLDVSVIERGTATGIFVKGSDSVVRLARSSVHSTRLARDGFGHGVTVQNGASVVLTTTSIVDNPGIGLAADAGRALVDAATIARNGVGIHVQNGSFLVEADDTSADNLGEGEVRIASTTRFSSNMTRIGSGIVPLPSPLP